MKLLFLVFGLIISASALPTGSSNINSNLQDAVKAASAAINDTLKYVADATKASTTGTYVQMIITQGKIAQAPIFTNLSRTIDLNKLVFTNGQAYVNSILDISIFGFNQLVLQIQEQSVLNEFVQKTVKTYEKICEILEPLLTQANKQRLMNTWSGVNSIRISTIDALEFVKAQTSSWQNRIKFRNEVDTVKPKFMSVFDKVYVQLFNNTLNPQNTKAYVGEYKQLNSRVVSVFGNEFTAAENVVTPYIWYGQYWYNLYMQINQVRSSFQQSFDYTLNQVNKFGSNQ